MSDSANYNMREYMKNVAYSLSKNDQNIDKKIVEYVRIFVKLEI